MKTYAKGVRSERELLHFLHSRGFSCIRAASSGGWISPVDVVALKKGTMLAFEIKAWAQKPKLEKKKLQRFKEWCDIAGAQGFLAWYNRNTWAFLPLKDAEKNQYEDERWLSHNTFFSIFI